ncbi:hypothetical protein HK414_27505 [Ramlibacter terrae]|uniref:Uncharacterized protein n=1 Tax=Ramlibacter terrae TaxID=2732511 RepID=A0ABX6P9M0_9BURK|nr:hypothetical protein HK414_27505 [Ramlibacter terrae]
MQAHAFARGELTVKYPLDLLDAIVPKQFRGYFISIDRQSGEAISKYWPGLALVTAPFAWLGIGWCVNPMFGALTLAMVYKLATEFTGQRAAGAWPCWRRWPRRSSRSTRSRSMRCRASWP